MVTYKNNWIPTVSVEDMAKTNYDVLIVGTGPGGGATLERLCKLWKHQGAKKIGIIEKGDKLFHSHALNIATQNVNTARDVLLPDNSTTVGDRLPQFPGARMVYALGGRSLFWNAATPRPLLSEIGSWPVPPMELDAYFRVAEELMHVTTNYAGGSSMQRVLMNRLLGNGILEAIDMPLAFDMTPSSQGEVHSNPWFSSINALASALFNRTYDLAINASASKVLVENGRARGVEVFSADKKKHTIRAKNIVLAASALETPRILLNSKIRGPAIGRYLTDHVSIITIGTINRDQFPDDLGNLAILKAETDQAPYQIQILGPDQYFSYQQFEDKITEGELTVAFAAFGRTTSRRENRVYIDPDERDEFGVPLKQVQFSYNEEDLDVAKQMADGIMQSAEAMRATVDPSTLTVRPAGSDMHESCSCRMGENPETSTTNAHGQVHGIEGLFVADNSVLPTLTAAGPVLSNVAFAIRLADHIYRQSL